MGAQHTRVQVKVREVLPDGTLGGEFDVQVSMSGYKRSITTIACPPWTVRVDTYTLVDVLYALGGETDGVRRVSEALSLRLEWVDNKPSVIYSILGPLGTPMQVFTLASNADQDKLAHFTRFNLVDWHAHLMKSRA